jgi:type IV pilus assembly protein PilV
MTGLRRARRAPHIPRQGGNFMLEALISILIVALGVLGVVGLYARSLQDVDDSKYRGEAALLVNSVLGQMWISDPKPASLLAKFDSSGSGAEYTEFAALVAQRMPNSVAPVITVTPGPTLTSSNVAISIQWRHPGDANDPTLRNYAVNATVGANQ